MAVQRRNPPTDRPEQDKLLERIARRYEELDEKLKEIEANVLAWDETQVEESANPHKPR